MNDIDLLKEKLSELNPPKVRAPAETWARFYQSKGLGEIQPDVMLDLIDELLEQVCVSIIDLEDAALDTLEQIEIDEDFEFEARANILHLFRAVMCFGTLEIKETVLDSIFGIWDFYLFPEFSDDISAAAKLAQGELDKSLKESFNAVFGDARNSVVKANAALSALNKSSEEGRHYVRSVLRRFDELHPDVMAVALLSTVSHKDLSEEDRKMLSLVLDSGHISHLGITRNLFESLAKTLPREGSLSLQLWKEERQWGFRSLAKNLRWFGVQGGEGELYLNFLGHYLSYPDAVHTFWYPMMDNEDSEPLDAYPKAFIELTEEKSIDVDQGFAAEMNFAIEYLIPRDIDSSRTTLGILSQNIAGFLYGLDEKFQDAKFPTDLNSLCNRIEEYLIQALDQDLLLNDSPDDLKLVEEGRNLWNQGFKEFASHCLSQKETSLAEKFCLKSVLDNFGIMVG